MGISLFKSSKEPTITDRDIAIADLKALQTNIDRQKKRVTFNIQFFYYFNLLINSIRLMRL